MSDNDGPVPTATSQPAPSNKARRASLADLFRPSESISASAPRSAFPSAMSQAQQQQNNHVRRLSITTLGLSGASAQSQQASPFSAIRDRGRSLSDHPPRPASVYEGNESAIAEDGDAVPPMNGTSPGSSGSLGRRMSAGARAYSDVRRGSGGSAAAMSFAGANGSVRATGSPPSARREGFNWSDSLRTRAERTSISAGAGNSAMGHGRTPSQTAAQASPRPTQQQQQPQQPPRPAQQKPDAFQERILKGDFYMD